MTWILIVWTLMASGGIQKETLRWPDRQSCEVYRASVEYFDSERPEGTGKVVGACRHDQSARSGRFSLTLEDVGMTG